MPNYKVLVILLLQFIGSGLLHIVCGYADINAYSLRNIVVVVVSLLFRGTEFVIIRIDLNLDSPPDFLLLKQPVSALLIINHTKPSSPPARRAESANREMEGRRCLSCLRGSRKQE